MQEDGGGAGVSVQDDGSRGGCTKGQPHLPRGRVGGWRPAGHGSSLFLHPARGGRNTHGSWKDTLPRSPSATAACRARAAVTVSKRERERRDFPDRKFVVFPSQGTEGDNTSVWGTQMGRVFVPAQLGSAASVPPAPPQPPEIPGTASSHAPLRAPQRSQR